MKFQEPVFATYLQQSQGRNMAAQRTECVRMSTALSDTCWYGYRSTSYQFADLSSEMSLMHVSFVPIKDAKGNR